MVFADGNLIRQNQNNAVEIGTLLFDVDGDVDIQHLRAGEISGLVDGDFTITDSINFLNNVDTTIVNTEFFSASGAAFLFPGLIIEGNLDWEIRFSSLTQQPEAPLQLSQLDRVLDSPFLDTDDDAGTAIFRLESFEQTEELLLAESDFNDFGSVDVVYEVPLFFFTDTQVPRQVSFNAIEFSDSDSIVVGNLTTNFVPSDLDQNATDQFESRVRISAGRGLLADENFPCLLYTSPSPRD